jgi:hypothetical protein
MKTEPPRKSACPSGSGEEGFILPVTLMVIGLISLLGATFLTVSGTEHTIASNEVKAAKAFNIAEAGLERAKTRLRTATEPLNNFLSGTSPGPNLYTGVSFDGGTYAVVISDDNDDANPNTDINNRVFIRATGTYGTARKQIVALVEIPPTVPGPRGAAESLGTYSEFDAENGGGAFDGRDWNAPANLSACTDVPNCGTLTANPATYATFTNTNANLWQVLNPGFMVGTGCLPPGCAGQTSATASKQVDTTVALNRWDNFIDAATPRATRSLTLGGTVGTFTGTYTWGTAAAPEITVISLPRPADPTTRLLTWNAQVNGAGVLIIETPGGTMSGSCPSSCNAGANGTIKGSGMLNWQGLIIIRSPGSVEFEPAGTSGKARIFGQVVNRSAGYAEIEFENSNSFVKYSSAAMALVQQAVGGSSTVRSWQEVSL